MQALIVKPPRFGDTKGRADGLATEPLVALVQAAPKHEAKQPPEVEVLAFVNLKPVPRCDLIADALDDVPLCRIKVDALEPDTAIIVRA